MPFPLRMKFVWLFFSLRLFLFARFVFRSEKQKTIITMNTLNFARYMMWIYVFEQNARNVQQIGTTFCFFSAILTSISKQQVWKINAANKRASISESNRQPEQMSRAKQTKGRSRSRDFVVMIRICSTSELHRKPIFIFASFFITFRVHWHSIFFCSVLNNRNELATIHEWNNKASFGQSVNQKRKKKKKTKS